jgi:transcriptional regulator with XRE-family HTH domain
MPRVARPLLPRTQRRAETLGERLRLARQRRGIPLVELAERVNTTRTTLTRLERGDLTVSLALLVRVLGVLGLEEDLDKLAADDELGRRLQDVRMPRPRRARIERPVPS